MPGTIAGENVNPVLPALNVRGELQKPRDGLAILLTLQWVTRYLWFLPGDPASAAADYFRGVMASLANLRQQPELRPSAAGFGTVRFCVRSLLDALFDRFQVSRNCNESRTCKQSTQHSLAPPPVNLI